MTFARRTALTRCQPPSPSAGGHDNNVRKSQPHAARLQQCSSSTCPVVAADNRVAATRLLPQVEMQRHSQRHDQRPRVPGPVDGHAGRRRRSRQHSFNNGNGTITYTALNPSWPGSDPMQYTITDTSGQVATANVTFTVRPIAVPDTATTVDAGDPATVNPMANDLGSFNPATLTTTTAPAHGTVTVANGVVTYIATITYLPNTGYTGVDTFPHTVTDTAGQTGTGQVGLRAA